MNRIYRLVYNRSLNLWQVGPEHARSQSKTVSQTA
ncbi:MAG: ESPR domain-containing protein, partial [Burkholderiales bacterium]|nr:ESPR domain-containing protein [Burkholderiales bacterium]